MKALTLRLDPWKWMGVVLVGGTPDQARAWLKKETGIEPNIGAHAVGHAYVNYGQPWLLWMDSADDVATLAHEALHIASGVLEHRGLKFTADSEEAYTYTMEFIVRAVRSCRNWREVGPMSKRNQKRKKGHGPRRNGTVRR